MFESSMAEPKSTFETPMSTFVGAGWGPEVQPKAVDGVGLFNAETHMYGMRGEHGGGETSLFEWCIFLEHIGEADIASRLVAAVKSRPTPFCYLHLLQGSGAVGDGPSDGTVFGCRD